MHTKSEHTIDDKQTVLEIHFLHTTDDPVSENKVLVVGVFFNTADGRNRHSLIRELVETIPKLNVTDTPLVLVNFFEVA